MSKAGLPRQGPRLCTRPTGVLLCLLNHTTPSLAVQPTISVYHRVPLAVYRTVPATWPTTGRRPGRSHPPLTRRRPDNDPAAAARRRRHEARPAVPVRGRLEGAVPG